MNLPEMRSRIERVKEVAASGDWDAAHALEDALHVDTLLAIADSDDMPALMARHLAWLAASTRDIQFQRETA